MKIAQVSPLAEPVPPIGYGGTERIVAYLSDELIRRGHEVTLFASGDSQTKGRLIAGAERALRLDSTIIDPQAHEIFQLAQVLQDADNFDIIHFHTGYSHFPLFRGHQTPGVTTFHGRLDIPDLNQLLRLLRQTLTEHDRLLGAGGDEAPRAELGMVRHAQSLLRLMQKIVLALQELHRCAALETHAIAEKDLWFGILEIGLRHRERLLLG